MFDSRKGKMTFEIKDFRKYIVSNHDINNPSSFSLLLKCNMKQIK